MTESEDDSTKKTRNWIARFLHRGRYGALPVREGGEQRSASQGDASPLSKQEFYYCDPVYFLLPTDYLFFSKSRISARSFSCAGGSAGAAAAAAASSSAFFLRMFCMNPRNFFIKRNTAKATIRKFNTSPMKVP